MDIPSEQLARTFKLTNDPWWYTFAPPRWAEISPPLTRTRAAMTACRKKLLQTEARSRETSRQHPNGIGRHDREKTGQDAVQTMYQIVRNWATGTGPQPEYHGDAIQHVIWQTAEAAMESGACTTWAALAAADSGDQGNVCPEELSARTIAAGLRTAALTGAAILKEAALMARNGDVNRAVEQALHRWTQVSEDTLRHMERWRLRLGGEQIAMRP